MPDALNEVFRVNNMLEDIGGLVDPEDLPEVEGGSSAGRDGTGAGDADELDPNDADGADHATPAKKTFVTSRPGMDGGSIGVGGGGTGSSMTVTRRMKHGSASLAEKLLSSISPEAEADQNEKKAVLRLYLQQIRAQEETIRMRELQIDASRKEVADLQDKLQSTLRELSRAERQADNLKMRLDMLEMMGTHRGRSSRRHRTHRKRSLPKSSSSASSSRRSPWRSQSRSRSVLRSKRHHIDLPVVSKTLEEQKGKTREKDDEAVSES
jgi:hypothetical protein